jgi:LPXTG-site transpeptidase (sortase) family protein
MFLAWADLLPEPIGTREAMSTNSEIAATENTNLPEAPVRVVAASIGLDEMVLNPESTDIKVLDEALLKGTVRYPNSAPLGVDGTMLLFGHSSYLPVVRNQNFKAFNGIQKLQTGSVVSVFSDTTEYRYTVTGVRKADASEDVIELPSVGKHLTLVTCNSFGTKSDRFVVTADFVGTYTR